MSTHLSHDFNPLPNTEVADDPGQQQAQRQVPVHLAEGHGLRHLQHAIAAQEKREKKRLSINQGHMPQRSNSMRGAALRRKRAVFNTLGGEQLDHIKMAPKLRNWRPCLHSMRCHKRLHVAGEEHFACRKPLVFTSRCQRNGVCGGGGV